MWSFEESVEALRGLRHRGWRMGLDRMEELCRRLGVKAGGSPKYVHVAGTNGKGSTVAMIEAILKQKYRTGATYSPYVYNVRERITGPEGMISEEDFARAAYEVCRVGDEMEETEFGGPTEFEAKTAMGFWYWNQLGLEYVVLETGLGGRLDATNIVTPEVSVITSIGLDHVGILGETEVEISREKAGILKPGVPGVVGRVSEPVAEAILEVGKRVEAGPVLVFGKEFSAQQLDHEIQEFGVKGPGWAGRYSLPKYLRGDIQTVNASTAVAAVKAGGLGVSDEEITAGLREARMPGRFEVVETAGRTWVYDGAHNAQAAGELAWTFFREYGGEPSELIVGMLEGHDPEPVLEELSRAGDRIHLVPINWTKTSDPEKLGEVARRFFPDVRVHWSVAEAVGDLERELVLVTGSFYLLGEVKAIVAR